MANDKRVKPEGSGRKKGTPNKLTQEVIDKLAAWDFDPIRGMCEVAHEAREKGDLNLAGRMYAELAQYIAPKRKAVEHTGTDGAAIDVITRIEHVIVDPMVREE